MMQCDQHTADLVLASRYLAYCEHVDHKIAGVWVEEGCHEH